MIVNNSLDEVKKRESAFRIIKKILEEKGRDSLFDVTGLSGGFIASKKELELLETYVGPAVFEDEIQIVGKEHLGGEKVLPVNRTREEIAPAITTIISAKDRVFVSSSIDLSLSSSAPITCVRLSLTPIIFLSRSGRSFASINAATQLKMFLYLL